MDSERVERLKYTINEENTDSLLYHEVCNEDVEFANKIRALLDHPKIGPGQMVDAYYYDYAELPRDLYRNMKCDMYLLYGITSECEIVKKWVGRWDLDR